MAQQAASAQAAQIGLLAALSRELTAGLGVLLPTFTSADMTRLMALVSTLVRRYGLASAALAARYYIREREAAGIRAPFRVPAVELPSLDQTGATLGWATAPLRPDPPDVGLAESRLTGAVDRMVLNVGRQTLVEAVQQDRRARGWARVARPDACSFCRLLQTRGAVYKSEQTAGRNANSRFVGAGEFKFHNNCHCYIEPVFGIYELSARARADLALYRESTAGLSGSDARKAFRQAVEQ